MAREQIARILEAHGVAWRYTLAGIESYELITPLADDIQRLYWTDVTGWPFSKLAAWLGY